MSKFVSSTCVHCVKASGKILSEWSILSHCCSYSSKCCCLKGEDGVCGDERQQSNSKVGNCSWRVYYRVEGQEVGVNGQMGPHLGDLGEVYWGWMESPADFQECSSTKGCLQVVLL